MTPKECLEEPQKEVKFITEQLADQGYVIGATVRQYHHGSMFNDAIIKHVHPNGALDVEIDGTKYGWSARFCDVIN